MIEPAQSLAFSIQSAPGVYALLLGSGVSRAAGIPTGWEITLDLIRKLASASGERADPSPEQWYRDTFGAEPDYSEIIQQLAKTRAERQQLLRSYVEPTEQEREDGKKVPTRAHHAVAALVERKFVRVIVTTNFDRLMETALAERNIAPAVLSSEDQILGAQPLTHARCTVVKVHGDYLDTRIRNTDAELERYPKAMDRLLDCIFDEYGLVVCGWSARWDGALRRALERSSSRRFTTYWATRSDLNDASSRLVERRRAEEIRIEDADTFLSTLREQVEAIEESSQPHPLSAEVAVASLKRYLPERRHRLRFSDLVDRAVDDVLERTRGDGFAVDDQDVTTVSLTKRLQRYDAACSALVAMATVGGFWSEEEHYATWCRALEKLTSELPNGGNTVWLALARYPATALLYALGVSATRANRLRFLKCLLVTPVRHRHGENAVVATELPASTLAVELHRSNVMPEGLERSRLPLTMWVYEMLRPHTRGFLPNAAAYAEAFDQFEVLLALNCCYRKQLAAEWVPVPVSLFAFRWENPGRGIAVVEDSLARDGEASPFVTSRLFGATQEECRASLQLLAKEIASWGP